MWNFLQNGYKFANSLQIDEVTNNVKIVYIEYLSLIKLEFPVQYIIILKAIGIFGQRVFGTKFNSEQHLLEEIFDIIRTFGSIEH